MGYGESAGQSLGQSGSNSISTERPGNSWLFAASGVQKMGNAL